MTSTQTAPSVSSLAERAALPLLWLPVPAVAAMAFFLVRGDTALSVGVADLDPLYGLSGFFIVAASIAVGVGPLVVAIIASLGSGGRLARTGLWSTLWTALAGLALVGFMAVGNASDPVLEASATYGDQYAWQGAAAFVVVVPLVVTLVLRMVDRPQAR